MSSAAKLRYIGRGTAVVASAALVMTSFGPAAFAAWDTPNASQDTVAVTNPNTGTIGIVDTDSRTPDNQGATVVEAGKTGQALADVRLVIPNRFKAGDVIDLRLFDRSATEQSDGNTNSGPSTLVGFSAVPTVTVDGPQDDGVMVTADTDSTAPLPGRTAGTAPINTEAEADNPWASRTGETGVAAAKPGVKPAFSSRLMKSPAGQGNDILRMTITSDPSTGDPNGTWVISLSDVKVDLGSAVTPGELRLVPFARNVQSNTTVPDEWFYGNQDKLENSDPAREIGIYTVPAYVAPVTFQAGSPNIIEKGGPQSIGDLVIKETHAASLTNATHYEVTIEEGATIANTAASSIKAVVSGGGTNEAVTVTSISDDKTTFRFSLAGADNTKASTITFSGLVLNPGPAGRLSFSLDGGSVSQYMGEYAGDGAAVAGLAAASAFCVAPGTSETTIANTTVATVGGQSLVGASTVAGASLGNGIYTLNQLSGNVWEILDADGDQVALATDGQNFSLVAPYSTTDTIVFGTALTAANDGDQLEVTGVTAPTATAGTGSLPAATNPTTVVDNVNNTFAGTTVYTVRAATAPATGLELADGATVVATSADGIAWAATNGDDVTFTRPLIVGDAVTTGTVTTTSLGSYTIDLAPRDITSAPAGVLGTLADDAYTIAYDTTDNRWEVTGANAGLVATSTNGTTFTLQDPFAGTFTLDEIAGSGDTFTVTPSGAYSIAAPGGTATVSASNNAAQTTYTVTASSMTRASDSTAATRTGQGTTADPFVYTFADGSTVTVAGSPATGATFTLAAAAAEPCVNQDDIEAPLDLLTQLGTVSAGTSSIGSTNRFGTAARIAHEYVKSTGLGYSNTAIVVNGLTAPDALSASFLSQREGAPILLTAPGQLPSETVEALRDLGVRKVYIVGGQKAVGSAVFNALKAQDAYYFDEAAKAIKPRGDKLEVIQLGGENRYQTNWRVNTYAAAQTADRAPVGKIAVGYGQPVKTTAMVARSSASNDFVDALSASVLSAGARGGLEVKTDAGASVTTVSFASPNVSVLSDAYASLIPNGTYRINDASGIAGNVQRYNGTTWDNVGTLTGNVIAPIAAASNPIAGQVLLTGAPAVNSTFTVTRTDATSAVYGYDTTVANRNALPTILTTPNKLVPEAVSQLKAMHIEHTLLIGSDAALSKQVNDDIAAAGPTSYRIEGKDRWETAANVNRFAMAPVSAAKTGDVPGLGFDGSHTYADAAGTNRVGGEMVTYLANGLKFPDALVAGPWVSRTRNSMVMTLQNDLPEPTAVFISEKAAQLDRAAGLGQGAAVSSGVIVEANRIASTK